MATAGLSPPGSRSLPIAITALSIPRLVGIPTIVGHMAAKNPGESVIPAISIVTGIAAHGVL